MKLKNIFFLLICLFNVNFLVAQEISSEEAIKRFGFQTYRFKSGNETVEFYARNLDKTPKRNLVIFLGGSDPQPTFSYEIIDGKPQRYFNGHKDYNIFSSDCIFVRIPKPGREGLVNEADLNTVPKIYLEKNSLDYRVWQTNEVINYCLKHIINKPDKVVVYGHSEGFNVVAKLVAVNKKITHAGLFGGSAMPDYFDFMMFKSKDFLQGKIDDKQFKEDLEKMQREYKEIFKNPTSTESKSIYTNKRWTSFAEPPINYLIKTKIPLYMLVSTKDANAPIESSYIVPLEFTRLGKTNLTYNICEGCDHSFNIFDKDGKKTSLWDFQIKAFVDWIDKTPKSNQR